MVQHKSQINSVHPVVMGKSIQINGMDLPARIVFDLTSKWNKGIFDMVVLNFENFRFLCSGIMRAKQLVIWKGN